MSKPVISPLSDIDDMLINLFDFEPIISELELVDDVERKQFSFKILEAHCRGLDFPISETFGIFSWIVPILAICGVADWLWRRLRRAPDPTIAR